MREVITPYTRNGRTMRKVVALARRPALLPGLVVAVLISMSAPAAAGPIVDPTTLQPEPPPGAVCRADGPWIICHTTFLEQYVNEPIFELPCGTLYATIYDPREGIRWYLDGKLVKRFVSQNAEGTWSLSPTGAGTTATVTLHANWRDVYAVPGDESSATQTLHGSFTVRVPGVGVVVHHAGIDLPDGTHRGVSRLIEDPAVAADLCAAFTA